MVWLEISHFEMLLDHMDKNKLERSNHWDCMLVKPKFRSSIKGVQTPPRADIDSDHSVLVAEICTRLQKITRFQKGKPRWDLGK